MKKYCKPCQVRGHLCEAVTDIDDEPWCVFCQDDEDCPQTKREKDAAKRFGVIGVPATLPSKQTVAAACECGEPLAPSNKSGSCPSCSQKLRRGREVEDGTTQTQSERVKAQMEASDRYCSRDCGNKIAGYNKSGICGKCQNTPAPKANFEVFDKQAYKRGPYKADARAIAVESLKKGKSVRAAAKESGLAKGTIDSIRAEISDQLPANCECGRAAGHRGWCKGRLAASPKRQALTAKLTKKANGDSIWDGVLLELDKAIEATTKKLQELQGARENIQRIAERYA